MKLRIGHGYDVHQLKPGNTLNLGGLEIPHEKGTIGHSDGDVLIHAIIDALLGAGNMRDIGFHFPDNDSNLKGIDSKKLLQETLELITSKGYSINNIDCTICLQKPKIKDYIPKMAEILAKTLKIDQEDISIKATTTEQLGFVGKEQGVSAYAVALLIKKND